MTLKTSFWRVNGTTSTPVTVSAMDLEDRLEDLIVADPDLLGPDQLLIIDRQVLTSHGKKLDILAIDEESRLHAIELKRARTPRDVVAQALDYGWWVRNLDLADVRLIWHDRSVEDDADFEDLDAAYEARFKTTLSEETFNAEHKLTIVAASLDSGTGRILEYLADDYGVPINVLLFNHFLDGEREYLSRTWLRPPAEDEIKTSPKRAHKTQARPWNGRDIFMPLGRTDDDPAVARWNHGLTYGFAGAGGGAPYWKFLLNLEPGMRIFAYVGGSGYVAVGEVTGPLEPLEQLTVTHEGEQVRFVELPECPQTFLDRIAAGDPDLSEYAVPVSWQQTRLPSEAVWEPGLFANQLPCRLKDTKTIELVESELGLNTKPTGFSNLDPVERLTRAKPDVAAAFTALEQACVEVGLTRSDRKWWVSFFDADGAIALDVVVRKSALKLYVEHDPEELAELGHDARDVTDIGHHGAGHTEITVRTPAELSALTHVLSAR